MSNNQRTDLLVGYLRIDPQISETDSETIEAIQTLLQDRPLGTLAKQRLALQLLQSVSDEMSGRGNL